jgi:hypothetical protein
MSARAFKAAVEAKDVEAAVAQLSPGVVFRSPVVHKEYEGSAVVAVILRAVFETFEDFRYVAEISDASAHVLEFRARVGDREIHGVDILREGGDGLIADFTVMVRPMSGMHALAERMREKLTAA